MADSAAGAARARVELIAAAVLCALLAVAWIVTLPSSPTYGWDESMHVALPAARMRIALGAGEWGQVFDALLGCAQYPFVEPVILAFVQSIFGATERVARAFGTCEWAATLLGLFVLVRVAIDSMPVERRPRAAIVAPWLALAFGALSPLGVAFSGTLFLETPSALSCVWTLVAWLALWRAPTRKRALVAGLLFTLSLFVKWNYGLLLGAGLTADVIVRLVPSASRRERLRFLPALALIPSLVVAWWFLLPWPGGADVAAQHREALREFLAGNQDLPRVAFGERLFDAACLLSPPPRIFLLVVVGLVAAFAHAARPALRALLLVLVAVGVPVWLHPFFLERFLLPGAVVAWPAAALGWAFLLSRKPVFSVSAVVALLMLAWSPIGCASYVPRDALSMDTLLWMDRMPSPDSNPAVLEYRRQEMARRQSMLDHRWLPAGGLERAESAAFLDLVATEAGPSARVGWIGVSSEISPSLLHLGLLDRAGSRARFLRDAHVKMDIDYFTDPHWDAQRIRAWAQGFDVVFWTDPPDVKGRPSRAWTSAAHEALAADPAWQTKELGRVDIARPLQPPRPVTLFACRRKS